MTFLFQAVGPWASAADLAALLPLPGAMTGPSDSFAPASLKGVRLLEGHGGLRLEFVLDKGDDASPGADSRDNVRRLVSYFLTALTLPGEDMWVNLSPYEGDRIVPAKFGMTEMGRDLLAQDYLLKQLSASFFYPEGGLGKEFWDKVYKEARERFGVSDVPVDTFNKVWIVPGKATVYENGMTGFILKRHLKVMLESDYLAAQHAAESLSTASAGIKDNVKDMIRQIILPAIEKEVNEGRQFAPLRQVYDAQILAVWFKTALKSSLLGKSYADRQKISGVDVNDPSVNAGIYQRYVQAFRQGVFNYVKEEEDPVTREVLPRKYFSGGAKAWTPDDTEITHDFAMDEIPTGDQREVVAVDLDPSQTGLEKSREAFRLRKEQLIMSEYPLSALGHGGPLDLGGFIASVGNLFILLEARDMKEHIPAWRDEVMAFNKKMKDLESRMKANAESGYDVSNEVWRKQQEDLRAWLLTAYPLLQKIISYYKTLPHEIDASLALDAYARKAERFRDLYIPVMEIFASPAGASASDVPAVNVNDVIAEFLRTSGFVIKRPDKTIVTLGEGDVLLESKGDGPYMVKVDPRVLCFWLERMLENAPDLARLRVTISREEGGVQIVIRNQGVVPKALLQLDTATREPFVFMPKTFIGPDHYDHEEFQRSGLSPLKLLKRLRLLGISSTIQGTDEGSVVAALNEILGSNLVTAWFLKYRLYSKYEPELKGKQQELRQVFELVLKDFLEIEDAGAALEILLQCMEDDWTYIDKIKLRRANRWLLQARLPALHPRVVVRKSFFAGGTSLPPLNWQIKKAGGRLNLANRSKGVVATTMVLPAADLAADTVRGTARPTSLEANPGGIDLNEKKLDLDLQGAGARPAAGMAAMATLDVEGFVPVIVRISPLNDLGVYLKGE